MRRLWQLLAALVGVVGAVGVGIWVTTDSRSEAPTTARPTETATNVADSAASAPEGPPSAAVTATNEPGDNGQNGPTETPGRSTDDIPEVWLEAPAGNFGDDIQLVLASATDRLAMTPTQLCGDLSAQNAWTYNGQDGLVIYGDNGQYVGWAMGPDAIDFPYSHRFGAHIGTPASEMATYPGASIGATGLGSFTDSQTETDVFISLGFITAEDRDAVIDRVRTMSAGDVEISCG